MNVLYMKDRYLNCGEEDVVIYMFFIYSLFVFIFFISLLGIYKLVVWQLV